MHYVILRDDDTNALTPTACLEQLYRPLLARGLPVCLSVIPEVTSQAKTPDGSRERFLPGWATNATTVSIGENEDLSEYLRSEPGYKIVQHGCHHDLCEFGITDRREIIRRLDTGAQSLREAGLDPAPAFVAPHDRFSSIALKEAAARFPVISTGWFEARRLPAAWWPAYATKKFSRSPHWRAGGAVLLSHPGCLLSYQRPYSSMLGSVIQAVEASALTVLVTHWWEYFRDGAPDEAYISVLHEVGAWLSGNDDVRVVSFSDVAKGQVPLN